MLREMTEMEKKEKEKKTVGTCQFDRPARTSASC